MLRKRFAIVVFALVIGGGLVGSLLWYIRGHTVAVLEPAGEIAERERTLIFVGLLLSTVVVVPVYVMTIAIALRYRESNHKKKKIRYDPDWAGSRLYEAIWWGIPLLIITILSIITWYSSHSLDPFKPLQSSVQPLTIQVVALDWRWLFIYPDEHIASVDFVEFPANTPINFEITSDTVMNSFWIPRLGSQIYAMPGMSTQLHLIANDAGDYRGSSANISGSGFADMTFTARSVSNAAFTSWLHDVRASSEQLTLPAYASLSAPTRDREVLYYSTVVSGLYDTIVMKYMTPAQQAPMMHGGA